MSRRSLARGTSEVIPVSGKRGLRETLHRLVKSSYFDWCVCLLIVLNAISLGIQTDYTARFLTSDIPVALRTIETGFCVIFTCELLVRLFVFRVRFFIGPSWAWNIFDTCIILLQLAEEIMLAIDSPQSDAKVLQGVSLSRLVRIVRLVRMVRFVRILRLVRELRMLVGSISSSLRPFGWTALLLLITIFMVGLYITQMVAEYRMGTEDTEEDLARFFGSVGLSMLSLFESITGGMDWDSCFSPLGQAQFHVTRFVFLLYVAFSVLAIMNVVTGLFIESVLRHAKAENDSFLVGSVHEIFKGLEGGIDGTLSWKDFEEQLSSKQMRAFFKEMDLNESEAKGLFCIMDLDGSGNIDLEEFLSGCLRLRGPAKAIDSVVVIEQMARLVQTLDALRAQLDAV